jgi:hypothetical protein
MSSESSTGFIKGVFAALGAIAALVAIYEFFIKPQFPVQLTATEPTAVIQYATQIPNIVIAPTQAPIPLVASTVTGGLSICGEPAFNGNLRTSDPLFLRPEGYLSGWISSDPSTVVLSNGKTKVFTTQYVLIVEDISSVQVKGVQRQAGKANTWGCWYSADISTFIAEDAKTDFCKKKAGNNIAVFYRVSVSGFEELGTTATISCP